MTIVTKNLLSYSITTNLSSVKVKICSTTKTSKSLEQYSGEQPMNHSCVKHLACGRQRKFNKSIYKMRLVEAA